MRRIGRWMVLWVMTMVLTAGQVEAEEEIYRIYAFEDLTELSRMVKEEGFHGTAYLMNNLEAQGSFMPIGSPENMFLGSFDGQGYEISGLRVEGEDFSGLFGYVGMGGSVRNLTLADIHVTGMRYTGGVAGYSAGSIENCAVRGGRIFGTSDAEFSTGTGGIAGLSSGTVADCVSWDAQVIGRRNVGGIVGGQCAGMVKSCLSSGEVWSWDKGEALTGGIIGSVLGGGEIRQCIHAGRVFAPDAAWVGGIAGGVLGGQMIKCVSLGEVTGREPGSIAGYAAQCAQIMACAYDSGNPVGEGQNSGMIQLPVRPPRLDAELLLPLTGQ